MCRNIRRHREGGDEGIAMVLVIGWGLVLMLLALTVSAYSLTSQGTSRTEQDYGASLAAAQAGIDDYLSRLNANNTYWQSVDCTNKAMQGPNAGTNTCGWTGSTAVGYTPVPGAVSAGSGRNCSSTPTPADCPQFHYDVNTSQTLINGTITITSTGKVWKVKRTAQAVLHQQGFADFLYYSDMETIDPANVFQYGSNNTTAQARCSSPLYYWNGGASYRNGNPCPDIDFIGADTINGPLHSNDAFEIQGNPTFNGPVSTGYTNCAPNAQGAPPPASSCYRNGGSAAPAFNKGISYAGVIPMPPSNAALKAQTSSATAQGTPGCLYTGPTLIKFIAPTGGQTVGTMQVWSPDSNQPSTTAACGGGASGGINGATIAVPNNNVVYVQAASTAASGTCDSSNNLVAAKLGAKYPQTGDIGYNYGEYGCKDGDLWLYGVVGGRVTLGADNDIRIADNLTYAGGQSGTDVAGLVANRNVEVYHPVLANSGSCSGYTNMNLPTTNQPFNNPVINAAILAVRDSFIVEDYPCGPPLGSLNIFGSIAQEYRGGVGTHSGGTIVTGYDKNYNYDNRLRYAPPPFYLNPSTTAYGIFTFAEINNPAGY